MAEKAEAIAGDAEKRVMVVAFDDSEHSIYALHWTLRHFFAGAHGGGPLTDVYKLLILHAAAGPSPVIGLGGPGVAAVLPKVESELWKISDQVIEKAREICVSNSVVDVAYEAIQGDARNVICDAVEKFHADVLVVGSHGYGAVKRAVLGSVSDYCAHHANCTVMIVKKPKDKH
ncbi:uncharacterized protein LOC110036308 isoform X1 [Phalaenopsis equestris]|uniref:uncharacterized protein LOC110036308 isoform X1 n=1 Tax=Phalaenopsis equestris TaxID=78828 RepID=UPI0009E5D18B|nr:uncharacterized protein LOC110036308 isoform X1 [Phalaenopsis equestris]